MDEHTYDLILDEIRESEISATDLRIILDILNKYIKR